MPLISLAIIARVCFGSYGGALCTCGDGETPAEAFDSAVAVFEARVVSVGFPMRATLHVARTWKGLRADTTITLVAHTNCAMAFMVDRTYLVYAHASGGDLQASRCSRTRLLSTATRDLEFLDHRNP